MSVSDPEEVPGETNVNDVLGYPIDYRGACVITREPTRKGNDRYRINWLDVPDDGGPAEPMSILEKRLIGCPACKENQYATFKDGEYHCPCGQHSNDLNLKNLFAPLY